VDLRASVDAGDSWLTVDCSSPELDRALGLSVDAAAPAEPRDSDSSTYNTHTHNNLLLEIPFSV